MQHCIIQVFAPPECTKSNEFDINEAHKYGFRFVDVLPADADLETWHDWYEEHAPALCKLHPLQIVPMPNDSTSLCQVIPMNWENVVKQHRDKRAGISADMEKPCEALEADEEADEETNEEAEEEAEEVNCVLDDLTDDSRMVSPDFKSIPIDLTDDLRMAEWMFGQANVSPSEIDRWYPMHGKTDGETCKWQFPDQKFLIVSLIVPSTWPQGKPLKDGTLCGPMVRVWKVLSSPPSLEESKAVMTHMKQMGLPEGTLPIYSVRMRELIPLAAVYDADEEPLFPPGVAQEKFKRHVNEMLHIEMNSGVVNVDDVMSTAATMPALGGGGGGGGGGAGEADLSLDVESLTMSSPIE